jgi:hypothetical protein
MFPSHHFKNKFFLSYLSLHLKLASRAMQMEDIDDERLQNDVDAY